MANGTTLNGVISEIGQSGEAGTQISNFLNDTLGEVSGDLIHAGQTMLTGITQAYETVKNYTSDQLQAAANGFQATFSSAGNVLDSLMPKTADQWLGLAATMAVMMTPPGEAAARDAYDFTAQYASLRPRQTWRRLRLVSRGFPAGPPCRRRSTIRREAVLSEYQYYEFQALDRPLDERARKALRALSSRARITATSFTNSYEWGDFKGDPVILMERWFDLHLYVANWGTHRLMLRFPKRLIDPRSLDDFFRPVDCAALKMSGENLILDIVGEELEPEDDWEDGSGWLAALAPLRADIIGGDLRLFYLLWLTAVEDGTLTDDAMEPLPGIGPLTGALDAFARFFGIDRDLVAAAAERSGTTSRDEVLAPRTVQRLVADLPDQEKNRLLVRLAQGESHLAGELLALLRGRVESRTTAIPPVVPLRTAAELRARAQAISHARKREKERRLEMEREQQAAEQERARRARLDALLKRGEAVWSEIEAEIERRNASGYDKALRLLLDIKTIAEEQGTMADFSRRLDTMRERHARKARFIDRLIALG